MIWNKISVSEQINGLEILTQLFYTWSIAHTDDLGVIPRNANTLRGIVMPLRESLTNAVVEKMISDLLDAGLYMEVESQGQRFIYVTGFSRHQTLKKDRNPRTILRLPFKACAGTRAENQKIYLENWRLVEEIIEQWEIRCESRLFKMESNWNPIGMQDKIREDKIREDKIRDKGEIEIKKLEKKVATKKTKVDYFRQAGEFMVSAEMQELAVQHFIKQGFSEDLARKEIKAFINFWTEPNKTGKRLKYEMKDTFHVGRRLATWFKNVETWQKGVVKTKDNIGSL